MPVSLRDRVAAWLREPPADRRRRRRGELLRFSPWVLLTVGTGFARLANMFWGYLPDSYALFGEHAEFRSLFARFSRHNRLNNAGDTVRLWAFILNIKKDQEEGIEGDFAERGGGRGGAAAGRARGAARAH